MTSSKKPQIKNDPFNFDDSVTATELRGLTRYGPIERLSLTGKSLLTTAVAKGLKGLQSVEHLWLWRKTTRTAMRYVVAIPGLRKLDVLGIESPGHLSGFSAAAALETFRCNLYLTKDDLLEVSSCRTLCEIGAQGAELTTSVLKKLFAMPNLQSLDIEGTRFDDRMAAHLHLCPSLHTLDIGATRLTRKGLEHIVRLPQLRSLDLWATRLHEADFDLLVQLPNLEYLSVGHGGGRQRFDPDTLLPRLRAVSSLKRLWLDGVRLTDAQKDKYETHFSDFRHTSD